MFNKYIGKLLKEYKKRGQKLVASYLRGYDYEWLVIFDRFNVNESGDFYFEMRAIAGVDPHNMFNANEAGDLYSELKAAGITELFYINMRDQLNDFDAFLAFQNAGAKLVGNVELENPQYTRDIENLGESLEKSTIPAIKWEIG